MVAGSGEARDQREAAGLTADLMGWVMMSPSVLGLRLVLASALIALLCVCAWPPGRSVRATSDERMALPRLEPGFRPATRATPPLPPVALFDLAEPGIDPVRVTSGIDPRSGLREDVLSRGDVTAIEAPALRVALTRGNDAGRPVSLFILMARRAASGPDLDRPALAVVRTGSRGQIQTKFGAVETLEATFGSSAPRTCTGFVTRAADFRLDGWSCAPLGRPPEPQALACTLDALKFLDLADSETTAAFSAASPSSHTCPVTRVADVSGRITQTPQRSRNKK